MRQVILAAVVSLSLAGCATDPHQFANSVNNVVANTQTAAVATVSIGTEILRAILALYQPVRDVVFIVTN